jgi:hypothetical protein
MKLVISGPAGNNCSINLPDDAISLAFWCRDTHSIDLCQRLFDQYGIPELIISEAHPEYPELTQNIPYYYCPTYLEFEANQLVNNIVVNDRDAEYCFNFIINKKQINRYLLLKLVEWFDLSSYRHTWSGTGQSFDMTRCLVDFDLFDNQLDICKFRSHMLSPVVKILPHFVDTDLNLNNNIKNDVGSIVDYGTNVWTWNNVVGDIFSKSAVSLISESISYEKIINYTEKTLYSIAGLTFPIWVGGYKQADLWKQHGFDTFDDVINHDYQYYDTLLERCFYAINDNLQILTDLDYARNKKQQNIERLKQNRSLLQPNIQRSCNNSLLKLPDIFKIFKSYYPSPGILNK